MKKKLIKFAAKLLFKRKVNKMERTLGDAIQLTKINEMIKKKDSDAKAGKVLKVILICTGVLAIAVAIGFILVRVMGRREDDYDLYDDLDNYYDESDHYDIPAPEEAKEGDFAE